MISLHYNIHKFQFQIYTMQARLYHKIITKIPNSKINVHDKYYRRFKILLSDTTRFENEYHKDSWHNKMYSNKK